MKITSETSSAARSAWDSGQDLDAGRIIFDSLTNNEQVAWAEGVLRACVAHGSSSEEIDRVLGLAGDRAAWRSGHQAFSAVRKLTLVVEASPERFDRSLLPLLLLAELVAKVLYNATQPLDPFDEDSGYWLAPCVRNFLATVHSSTSTVPAILASLFPNSASAA